MSHDGQYQEDIQGNAVGSNGGREFALPEIRNTAQNVTDTSAFADGQQNSLTPRGVIRQSDSMSMGGKRQVFGGRKMTESPTILAGVKMHDQAMLLHD